MSGFQVHFGASDVYTPGDSVDALVAMNPAALRVNLPDLKTGGILIVNADDFKDTDLRRPASRRARSTTTRSTATASSRSS